MSKPARHAYYSVRDLLAHFRSVVVRHSEEAEGTELFVALEELRVAIEGFENAPAVKRLQALHLEEFQAAQRPST